MHIQSIRQFRTHITSSVVYNKNVKDVEMDVVSSSSSDSDSTDSDSDGEDGKLHVSETAHGTSLTRTLHTFVYILRNLEHLTTNYALVFLFIRNTFSRFCVP